MESKVTLSLMSISFLIIPNVNLGTITGTQIKQGELPQCYKKMLCDYKRDIKKMLLAHVHSL